MTIRTKLQNLLENHGLWPEEIKTVIEKTILAEENELMAGRWDEDESNYPPAIMNLAWFSAKTNAIEHLESTKPKHFALHILKNS